MDNLSSVTLRLVLKFSLPSSRMSQSAGDFQERAPIACFLISILWKEEMLTPRYSRLVGVTVLGDTMKCAKDHGIVCITGIAGGKWVFENF
jgi:hypothetical protein